MSVFPECHLVCVLFKKDSLLASRLVDLGVFPPQKEEECNGDDGDNEDRYQGRNDTRQRI